MINRRDFIHAGWAIAAGALGPSIVDWAEAKAEPSDSSAAKGFNGGVTQTNAPNAQVAGAFPFINFIKTCQEIFYLRPPSDPAAPKIPILELDPDGYPTRMVDGTGGYGSVFSMPTAAEYGGNWVLKWDGSGTVIPANFSHRIITSGPGRVVFKRSGSGGSPGFQVTATKPAPDHVRNIRLCRSVDEAAMDAGEQFYPDHITLMRSAKPGAIRSLGWGGGWNGTNTALIATWVQRRPRSYISYEGGVWNPNWFGGTTSSSGSDHTLAFNGFSLTDKAVAQFIFNASAPQSAQTFFTNAPTTSGSPIVIPWTSHNLAAGNAVAFGKNPPAPLTNATTYYVKTVKDANNFTVAAAPTGVAISASSTTTTSFLGVSIPRININNTGFVPMTGAGTPVPINVFVGYNTQVPVAGMATVIYDATTGWFRLANEGLTNGGPPEVFVDYCAAVGAHPWLVTPFMSVEPLQDYVPTWVGYIKSNYSWMKPLIEPPNECWNYSSGFLGTSYADSLAYALWGTQQDHNNAYGKWCSVLGQAIGAIYGNDRTKYSVVCAIQTGSFHGSPGTGNDPRLKSTLYVARNGGDPAYKWVDYVAAANYYSPAQRFSCQELIDAYAWSVTHAANPAAQLAIANAYAATAYGADTSYTLQWVTNALRNLKAWAQGMPGGNTIKGMVCYEGGWSPDYLNGNWSTEITSATNANPCVFTLASTSANPETSALKGNPAVVGMQIALTGLTGAYTTYNGRTVDITRVSGNEITTSLDASVQPSIFAGRAIATYVNSMKYSNNLRLAGGNSTAAGTINAQIYADYFGLASPGFSAEYPSNFVYFGSGTVWFVLQPDIYAPATAQWNSIVAARK